MKAGSWRPRSLAEVARRAREGSDPFDHAVREFLDSFSIMDRKGRAASIGEAPPSLTPLEDAYLAAVAEHLARVHDLPIPAWTDEPGRFLERPYFAGGIDALKARLLVESPLAFRRRLIFVSENALSRPPRR